ncbi:hypothetical protein LCGC14_2028640 [marine sediment metagenome]|uniref:Uncharacterized protein n=1 Tax=marine sediment metagenome TaxID=412755 RepID=A0A0F9H8S5_9ZZZZ
MINGSDIYEAERRMLSSSFLLRMRANDSRWLIRSAILYLPTQSWRISENTKILIFRNLRKFLKKKVRDIYGNPIIIFILVNIIIPIIIRLVIDWWLNRENNSEKEIGWIK